MNIKISGIGSYIPEKSVSNTDFTDHVFLNEDGSPFGHPNEVVVNKFKSITGIENRRYANDQFTTSDLGYFAAQRAITNANIDPETIDYIIFAHNFGDVKHGTIQSDMLPSLATRVKNKLQIQNPKCVAYDLLFGCPGWIEGVLQANAFIKSGMAKSYNTDLDPDTKYIKMYGRKIYEFALSNVPAAMKSCLDKSGLGIDDVKKILIHQANEKMDEAIVHRFYKLYGKTPPKDVMPMSIHDLGNSSVATVPTLFDQVLQGKIENQEINKGDVLIFASVGAGMNINAFVYRY